MNCSAAGISNPRGRRSGATLKTGIPTVPNQHRPTWLPEELYPFESRYLQVGPVPLRLARYSRSANCGIVRNMAAFCLQAIGDLYPNNCSRCRSPVARTARRPIAARTDASDPTTRTFPFARVTAV
jgi:hypothetical protein